MFFRRKKGGSESPGASKSGARPSGADARPESQELRSDAPTTQFLSGDPDADSKRLRILTEINGRVHDARNNIDDLEGLLETIVDSSIEVTGAERGLLVMRSREGELTVRVARSKANESLEDDRYSTSIATRVLDEGVAMKATVQSDTEALELGQSVFDLKLRQVMCVPLQDYEGEGDSGAEGRTRGVLYVDSRAATRHFKQSDLYTFSSLALAISMALQNAQYSLDRAENERVKRLLEESEAIQKHLMPEPPGERRGFDLHGWYRPAEHAAGDFFDFIEVEGDALGVVVGDVSGHGIGPALITASAQGRLSAYLSMVDDLGVVFTRLNRDLSKRIEPGRFMTLFVALLRSDGRVDCLNAGHQPAMVWRAAENRCVELPGDELAIGFSDDHQYGSGESLELGPGDALLAYTDGVTEARDPSTETGFLGRDGLARLFSECMREGLAARETALRLADAAMAEGESAVDDDITLVVARRL